MTAQQSALDANLNRMQSDHVHSLTFDGSKQQLGQTRTAVKLNPRWATEWIRLALWDRKPLVFLFYLIICLLQSLLAMRYALLWVCAYTLETVSHPVSWSTWTKPFKKKSCISDGMDIEDTSVLFGHLAKVLQTPTTDLPDERFKLATKLGETNYCRFWFYNW